jgi:RNA polymerase sigma factor (sigma-70 family)
MPARSPDDDPRTDEGLMLAYGAGDAAAFETLYKRWRQNLYRFVVHQSRSGTVADELFQEIWLSVINARKQYEPTAKFTTWLFRIAHNRLVDHWRKIGRSVEINESALLTEDDEGEAMAAQVAAPGEDQPERLLERKALATRIVAAIEALPALQGEAFMLAEEAGMTVEEIAGTTGVGHETAKSRLRYAFAKLRAELQNWKET